MDFSCFRRDRRRHPVADVRLRRATALQLHRVPISGVQVSAFGEVKQYNGRNPVPDSLYLKHIRVPYPNNE